MKIKYIPLILKAIKYSIHYIIKGCFLLYILEKIMKNIKEVGNEQEKHILL